MGSMFEEMKKVKKHLRQTQSERQKQDANEVSPNREKALATSSPPSRSKASRSPHPKRDQKSAFKHPIGQAPKKSRHGLGGDRDLSGHTKRVIQLPTGGTHDVFVKRTGPTSTIGVQAKPSTPASRGDTHRASVPSPEQPERSVSEVQPSSLTIRSFRLAHPDEFKHPDDWVGLGSKVTLSATGKALPTYMGIDFGTAYTKASIGFSRDIFIVDWAGIKAGTDKFTLPGEFSVLPDGSCVLGRSPQATRIASDLKRPFLKGQASESSLIDATIFLALIMRYIRAWWFHHHSGLVWNRSLEWYINLGAPTTPWQNDAIRTQYERAARAAWTLSVERSSICDDHAKDVLERVKSSPDESLPPVEIVAEFVAQIACYTRSPQRQSDLHMLVDVGAGTVDVVTFNIHRDNQTDEDKFPIFSASVSKLGTHYLMERRLRGYNGHWDDASCVPSPDLFSEKTGIKLQKIMEIDREHSAAVKHAVGSVLRETKHKRYRQSQNWKKGISVFLCGGGSSCSVFQQATQTAAKELGVHLNIIKLPLPDHLKAPYLPQDQFHRVSVAFGLGMNADNLGRTIPMAEVEDDAPAPMPERAHFDWND